MPQLKNPMEIFKLLDKSNCRECNEATCLAFAVAVFKGQKQLDACPDLSGEIIERYGGEATNHKTLEQKREQAMEQLKRKVAAIDFSFLICYWKPDDGLESDLNIFFDSTAEENLNIESIYTLGVGLVIMFEKLALRHGLQ